MMKTAIRYAVRAVALFVALYATLSLLDYIGTTFGAFWIWVAILSAVGALTAYAEHHERNHK
jgi:hypothetical protein